MTLVNMDFPNNTIIDRMCSESMNLAARKHVRHESINRMLFGRSTNIAALTEDIHIVRGATGTLVGLQASINGTLPGGDRTATVDLQKSTGGGAFASVLSSTITFSSASSLRTALSAVIDSTKLSLVAGDQLAIIVTVGGSSGTQPQGLHFTLTFEETYA